MILKKLKFKNNIYTYIKMRVAICLHGKIDGKYKNWTGNYVYNNYKNTSLNIKKHLIDPFNSDVFFHAFADNISSDVVEFYNPVKYEIDNDKDFSSIFSSHPQYINFNSNRYWENRYSEMYTIKRSLELVKESKNKYDIIIFTRFDINPLKTYDINSLNPDILYTSNKTLYNKNLIGAFINISKPSIINIYIKLFDKSYDYIKDKNTKSIHPLVRDIFKENGYVNDKNIKLLPFETNILRYPYS